MSWTCSLVHVESKFANGASIWPQQDGIFVSASSPTAALQAE